MIRTRLQGDTPFFPNMLNNGKVEVCLKEDVDNVIAEKDKVITYARVLVREDIKLIRHQKYKRCLAMAKWCFTKSNYHFVLARHGEDVKENNRRSILYSKWRKR